MHMFIQDDCHSPDDCAAELTANGATQPMLFHVQSAFWIKADNTAVRITGAACFHDCVQFLMYSFFVFNVSYPPELKMVYGVLERLLGIAPTMKRSAVVDDFMQQLLSN